MIGKGWEGDVEGGKMFKGGGAVEGMVKLLYTLSILPSSFHKLKCPSLALPRAKIAPRAAPLTIALVFISLVQVDKHN